ncbi:MAG: helix-turn-helix transcriptional regulator [Micropepsaceae bacterium]
MNRELADFLRSRRERLAPKVVGLVQGFRRRTPGLRREEVAELAGIGVDWYVRLEQGRPVRPSAGTVDAIARALRLSKAEHAHLRALTGTNPLGTYVRETVPDTIARIVQGLTLPAYITGRRWDVLAWNAEADSIFGFGRMAEPDRNIILSMLTTRAARDRFGAGWPNEARRMVAQFRLTHDLWAHEPAFRDLVERLKAGCPEFSGWWRMHDVRGAVAGRKVLHHPKGKAATYEYATFQANDDAGLKLAIYAPVLRGKPDTNRPRMP